MSKLETLMRSLSRMGTSFSEKVEKLVKLRNFT